LIRLLLLFYFTHNLFFIINIFPSSNKNIWSSNLSIITIKLYIYKKIQMQQATRIRLHLIQ